MKTRALTKLSFITATATTLCLSLSTQAEMTLKAQTLPAKPLPIQASSAPKPPTCASGFVPVGQKLIQHEGKKWYEYSCAQEKMIIRTCSADTDVTEVKNQFIDLPADGQSHNSKLRMSYKCFNYVPVE